MRIFPLRSFPILAVVVVAALGLGGAGLPPSIPGPVPLYDVDLSGSDAWGRLVAVDVDLISVRPGYRALVLGWPGAREALEGAGLCPREVVADYGLHLARENGVARGTSGTLAGASAASTGVPPFGEGSLGGFWTYDEVAALLDSLAASDVDNILTEVDTIGTSRQGRPILAIGVAGPGKAMGTRPEALFTSLTHAREPESMQSALHFLLALIDGYGTDPVLTYLVDEREIWFIPVVNPDGYTINEATWLSSGGFGFWRKNARDNDGDGAVESREGVDLNRNFGYQWGYDNVGSSSNPASDVYRGPAAFSEPETQAVRDFCAAHAFRTADNLHTYYEASLYPWGYVSADTPDSAAFVRLGDAKTESDRYAYGRSGQVLYPVNGDANDWMYGDVSKPQALAYTTEIGNQNDGFWPPPSRILPLAELTMPSHVATAYAAGAYVVAESLRVEDSIGVLRSGETRAVKFHLRHIGATSSTSGGITVHVTSSHPAVTPVDGEALFPDLAPGEGSWPLANGALVLHADAGVVPGDVVRLHLEITDAAGYVGRDTLSLRVGEPTVVFADSGDGSLAAWIASGGWGLEAVDGDSAFADSPGADYAVGADSRLTLVGFLDLSGAASAVLRFRARWDIEVGFDFATVEVSADSGATWTPRPGGWTRPGHGTSGGYTGGTQTLGLPGYDGDRRLWVDEEIDLSDYAGNAALSLRFRLRSDAGVEMAGWLIDDVSVLAYPPAPALSAGADPAESPGFVRPLRAFPNPFSAESRIRFTLDRPSSYRLALHDVAGREIRILSQGYSEAGEREIVWDGRGADGRRLPRGTYFARLDTPGSSVSGRLLLLR
jgi:hypothetical protein